STRPRSRTHHVQLIAPGMAVDRQIGILRSEALGLDDVACISQFDRCVSADIQTSHRCQLVQLELNSAARRLHPEHASSGAVLDAPDMWQLRSIYFAEQHAITGSQFSAVTKMDNSWPKLTGFKALGLSQGVQPVALLVGGIDNHQPVPIAGPP